MHYVPKGLKEWKILILIDFNVLKIERNLGERKTHSCTYVLWPVSFKKFQDNHPFVC